MPASASDHHGPAVLARDLQLAHSDGVFLRCASFTVAPGELVWLQGESGSGKTSLLRALARLEPLHGGELRLGEATRADVPARIWRSRILFVGSPPVALGDSIAEDLRAPFRLKVRRATTPPTNQELRRSLAAVGLEALALDRATSDLSLGQRSRVAFLRARLARPEFLLLDEPFANLDAVNAGRLLAALQEPCAAGPGVVVATHGEPAGPVHRRYRIEDREVRESPPT